MSLDEFEHFSIHDRPKWLHQIKHEIVPASALAARMKQPDAGVIAS